jgi:hypothetical protein
MAENESLDLGKSPRMRVVYDAYRNGASDDEVVGYVAKAVTRGFRNALKEFRAKGVSLSELLKCRNSPRPLQNLLRKLQGHDYARLFVEVVAVSGPTDKDCLAGWIGSVVDKMTDQICHRVAGNDRFPTMEDALLSAAEIRGRLQPIVERLATKLAVEPDSLPRQSPAKGNGPVDATTNLMNFSLLGGPTQ